MSVSEENRLTDTNPQERRLRRCPVSEWSRQKVCVRAFDHFLHRTLRDTRSAALTSVLSASIPGSCPPRIFRVHRPKYVADARTDGNNHVAVNNGNTTQNGTAAAFPCFLVQGRHSGALLPQRKPSPQQRDDLRKSSSESSRPDSQIVRTVAGALAFITIVQHVHSAGRVPPNKRNTREKKRTTYRFVRAVRPSNIPSGSVVSAQ